MPMRRDVYPLTIHLPDGKRAEYVAGERPPRYTIDGAPCDIDVTIPPDLADTWYWSGSFLYQPWPERADGPGVAISTGTFGVEGTFEAARRLDAKRVEVQVMLKARPVKKRRQQASRSSEAIRDADAELSSNFSQMELAL